tara:strand:- start:326 stop:649 length:324 start_codon:yes stop_codon:yes gene_type:complete
LHTRIKTELILLLSMMIEVLDPTYEGDTSSFKYAAGLKNLKGATVGIISNGKKGTFHFFNALEDLLTKKYKAGKVIQVVKKNYSAPAEEEIMKEVKKWDAAIAGVGD